VDVYRVYAVGGIILYCIVRKEGRKEGRKESPMYLSIVYPNRLG
jgi:hypothetical protein